MFFYFFFHFLSFYLWCDTPDLERCLEGEMEGPSVGEHRLPGNNKSTDNVGGVSPPQSTEGGGGNGGRARSSTGDIKPESSTSPRSGPEGT